MGLIITNSVLLYYKIKGTAHKIYGLNYLEIRIIITYVYVNYKICKYEFLM